MKIDLPDGLRVALWLGDQVGKVIDGARGLARRSVCLVRGHRVAKFDGGSWCARCWRDL